MTASRTRTLSSVRTHTSTVGLLIPGQELRVVDHLDPSGKPAATVTITNDVAAAHISLTIPDGVDELIGRLRAINEAHRSGPQLVLPPALRAS